MGFLTSKSGNKAYPWAQKTFQGTAQAQVAQGQQGLNTLNGILQGTDSGQGFRQFQQSTGYKNILSDAMRGVSGSAAARGLLNSGSTARALQTRASQLGQQSYGNYLQQLLGASQASTAAGQGLAGTITGAGNYTQQGLGDALSGMAQAAATAYAKSDRRAKDDIILLEREDDGLGIYSYRYKGEDETRVGVMADEVAELRPHALGPEVDGFQTVCYGRLDD